MITMEVEDNKFRLITQAFKTKWLPNTLANRKVTVIMLYHLTDENGKNLFTLQELSEVLNSESTATVYNYIGAFRDCEEDFLKTLQRKRKVDEEIINATRKVWEVDPEIGLCEIVEEVKDKLNRDDIDMNNIRAAMDQIPLSQVRIGLKNKLAKEKAHYKEKHLLKLAFDLALEKTEKVPKLPKGMLEKLEKEEIIASSAIAQKDSQNHKAVAETKELFCGEVNQNKLTDIWNTPLGWKLWSFILYFHGVSQETIGGWLGVNKSTICHWLKDVSCWSELWVKTQKVAYSCKVAIDEKWIKIAGEFWYLFVAIDCVTGYPLHTAIYPSNDKNYCQLFLLELKKLGYYPKLIITDGWDGYIKPIATVFPKAEHLLCRFHVICSIFRRLNKVRIYKSKISVAIGNLFKTDYKRTVLRRIDRLKEMLQPLSAVGSVLGGLEQKLPQVIKAVGSTWRPSTSNAAEVFFSKFERFYRLKGPFCDQASAQKHLQLFLLGYLFTVGAKGQACPLEKACSKVTQLPFYHLINRPNIIALKERIQQQYKKAS